MNDLQTRIDMARLSVEHLENALHQARVKLASRYDTTRQADGTWRGDSTGGIWACERHLAMVRLRLSQALRELGRLEDELQSINPSAPRFYEAALDRHGFDGIIERPGVGSIGGGSVFYNTAEKDRAGADVPEALRTRGLPDPDLTNGGGA